MKPILWLDEAPESDATVLGGKGANLAAMCRAGFPVPAGFCLTTVAYQTFVAANGLTVHDDADRWRATLAGGRFPPSLEQIITTAYRRLGSSTVAVRSSATAEDLPAASFAGQQDTFLNVHGETALLDAIRRCWASLWTERAVVYRRERGHPQAEACMAVVVQAMIPCDVAGVAFSVDPLTGARIVVIEATPGSGQGVVGGMAKVERYTVGRTSHQPAAPDGDPLLSAEQVQRIAETVLALERMFGRSQDVEWGLWGDELYLFQSRPLTVPAGSWFTDVIPGDGHLWTGGFLNERFPHPVSPLGWTLIRELLEPLAFRDPLRFMGFHLPADMPITKLYRGHPFVNVGVFQILYKPFPDFLLPEDARRYFPHGDIGLRRQTPYPCCLFDPRLVLAMMWHFVHDPATWSPLHNYRQWATFVREHDRAMETLHHRAEALGDGSQLGNAWTLVTEGQTLNARLLAIHRWSLTDADLFYSLLRRMLATWLGEKRGTVLCARLVAGLPNKSVELNRALHDLATDADWRAFMRAYGHRSFSLDIYHPTFADKPAQVRRLKSDTTFRLDVDERVAQRESARAEAHRALESQRWGWLKVQLFERVLVYTQHYMPLREDQRFYWQKTLAQQRRLFLWIGQRLAERGWLKCPDDIFFATVDEVRRTVNGQTFPADEVAHRRAEFARLQCQSELAPHLSYPHFLRGSDPLRERVSDADRLCGQPVSPGLARGPVRVVTAPSQFDRIEPGDVLVTRGADPGWTPVFGRIAGLVMEVGGQLSHGAVVAREYGLPAVAGIPAATQRLQDGQQVVVDGLSGTVTLIR